MISWTCQFFVNRSVRTIYAAVSFMRSIDAGTSSVGSVDAAVSSV